MMQDISHRHEYDNIIWDTPIYASKNMDLANWLLQIDKMALLRYSKGYEYNHPI